MCLRLLIMELNYLITMRTTWERTIETEGKRVGFISGCLDLPLAELLPLLTTARAYCDILIVAVNTNPQCSTPGLSEPARSFDKRMENARFASEGSVFLQYDNEAELAEMLVEIHPDVRFVSSELISQPTKRFTGDRLPIKLVHLNYSCWQLAGKAINDLAYAA